MEETFLSLLSIDKEVEVEDLFLSYDEKRLDYEWEVEPNT